MTKVKLFDLLSKPNQQFKELADKIATDIKIPNTIQTVDSKAQNKIDSESNKPVQEPPQSVQEIKHIDPMWSGTTSTVIDGNTISSGTSFSGSPAIPVVKKKKSDRPVVVSIKDQMKKKARRKLAAASRRKNR
jgi:hypothetical protein